MGRASRHQCLVREPHRRRLNALMVAGAGAACLSGGGLGGWKFAFTALSTCVAHRGLDFLAAVRARCGWSRRFGRGQLDFLCQKH